MFFFPLIVLWVISFLSALGKVVRIYRCDFKYMYIIPSCTIRYVCIIRNLIDLVFYFHFHKRNLEQEDLFRISRFCVNFQYPHLLHLSFVRTAAFSISCFLPPHPTSFCACVLLNTANRKE